MKRWLSLGLMFCAGWMSVGTVEAGVKGGRFQGSVFNSYGNIVEVDDYFYTNNTVKQIESGVNTFNGTYTEQGLLGVTTWQATLQDGSPDGFGLVGGTCYFGLVSTHWTLNTDINISAFGLVYRTGFVASPSTQADDSSATVGNGQ